MRKDTNENTLNKTSKKSIGHRKFLLVQKPLRHVPFCRFSDDSNLKFEVGYLCDFFNLFMIMLS